MISLHEEITRYLSAIDTVREEIDNDFLRFGSDADAEREQRRIAAESGLVARVNAYGRASSAKEGR